MGSSIMIYVISNYLSNKPYYVCPDQATINAGIAAGYTGNFSIGVQADAQAILNTVQQNLLFACSDRFGVNKDIDATEGITWQPVDLNTEPDNTDVSYQVFSTINGSYTQTTGLDNAKALYAQVEQDFLDFCNLGALIEWESFPPLPTQGLQTL